MPCILKSCCCFDLRTGTMLIGFLELVFGIIMMVSTFTKPQPNLVEVLITVTKLILAIVASVMLILGVKKVRWQFFFLERKWVLFFPILEKTALFSILDVNGNHYVVLFSCFPRTICCNDDKPWSKPGISTIVTHNIDYFLYTNFW